LNRSPDRPDAKPIAIAGFMGAGKSAVAFAAAAVTGRMAVDLDRVIEHTAGRSIARIWETEGEGGFRVRELTALREQLVGPVVVALGGGALSDDAAWDLVKVQACSVWLDAPLDLLWQRAGKDPSRPLAQDRAAFEELFENRRARYSECDHRLDATRPVVELAEEVARLCGG
jgi:shikimate kinase